MCDIIICLKLHHLVEALVPKKGSDSLAFRYHLFIEGDGVGKGAEEIVAHLLVQLQVIRIRSQITHPPQRFKDFFILYHYSTNPASVCL